MEINETQQCTANTFLKVPVANYEREIATGMKKCHGKQKALFYSGTIFLRVDNWFLKLENKTVWLSTSES